MYDPDHPADVVIQVADLKKVYAGGWLFRKKAIEALRGVTLNAKRGEVFGLLGPNGAGKTTLIKTLLGIIQPTSGTASLFGVSVRSPIARHRIGYLPESLRIDRHHSATSALRYYGRLSGMSPEDIARRQEQLLPLVGLEKRARESVRRFSKGMYQRLGLAQALMHDPDLLILDEPTDGLDPVGRREVRRVIERLRDDGKTIFLNSHILQEVELVCTRVAIMAEGTLRGLGTIDELRDGRSDGKRRLDLRFDCRDAVANGSLQGSDHVREELRHAGFSFAGSPVTDIDALDDEGDTSSEVGLFSLLIVEQGEIDALVDWLRDRGISILELRLHQTTLEETFLKRVHGTTASTTSELEASSQ